MTIDTPGAEIFYREIRAACHRVMILGPVAHRLMVAGAHAGVANMATPATKSPIMFLVGEQDIEDRFHYSDDGLGLNFRRERAHLHDFLLMFLPKPRILPLARWRHWVRQRISLTRVAQAHPVPLLPPSAMLRMWIGDAATVTTHNDKLENIACAAADRRRFKMFLSEAIAQVAEMEAGDALYIPYQRYHHVDELDPDNISGRSGQTGFGIVLRCLASRNHCASRLAHRSAPRLEGGLRLLCFSRRRRPWSAFAAGDARSAWARFTGSDLAFEKKI